MEKNQKSSVIEVKDGIINKDEFQDAPIKILWVLKEPYAKEGEVEYLYGEGYLKFFREYEKHSTLAHQTVHKIIYASYAILNNKEWEDIPRIKDNANVIKILNKIAIINIKKVPKIISETSNKTSRKEEIMDHFIKNLEYIKKQITDINPNVVIWAFWSLLGSKELGKLIFDEDVIPKDCFQRFHVYDYYYFDESVKDVLHIIVDHPACPNKRTNDGEVINEEKYVNEIKNIYCEVFKCKK